MIKYKMRIRCKCYALLIAFPCCSSVVKKSWWTQGRERGREIGTFDRQMESSNSLQVAWAAALVIMGLISKEQGTDTVRGREIGTEGFILILSLPTMSVLFLV